ncbi:MAG: phosphoglucosamine mutase, partial [Gammaproteobacteria bacterium]
QGRLHGGVVGTLMTNFGIEQAFREAGIDFARAKVGDRYVMEQLFERDWYIGGEGSGHIVCRDVTTTGDGIVSALQVLSALAEAGCAHLSDMLQGVHKTPQTLINVRMKEKRDVTKVPEVAQAVAEAEGVLGDQGRVLIRLSGTEPVVRVMVEGTDKALVDALAQQIAEVVRGLEQG